MKIYEIEKRIFDIFISLISLVVLLPLMVIISILIKLTSAGPILFRQERVGLDQKILKILKFRTMVNGAELSGKLATNYNDPRITRVGKVLRKYKLDEIPQFYNVFIGEMSIV
ncbi:MAG: sugar transferase, partial [Minisyncoccia bacterium]